LTPPIGDGTKNGLSEGNSLIVHKSAIKRHRQSLKRRERNIETKSKLRTLIKRARQAIEAKNQETASAQIQAVNKALGKAVSKGIIKRNTASRWLSRLSRSAARRSAAG
jgi:small subunit ribosomal protein S20